MCVLNLQELRQDAELQEGNLGWLRTRMAALIEVCSDSDGQRHGGALGKLYVDFKGLIASLSEVGRTCFHVVWHRLVLILLFNAATESG